MAQCGMKILDSNIALYHQMYSTLALFVIKKQLCSNENFSSSPNVHSVAVHLKEFRRRKRKITMQRAILAAAERKDYATIEQKPNVIVDRMKFLGAIENFFKRSTIKKDMDIDELLKLLSTLINKMIDKNLGRGVSSSKSVSPDEVKDLSVLPDKVEDLLVSPDEVEDVNTSGSSTGSVVPGDTACFNTMLQFINQLKSEIAGGSDAVLSDDEKETLKEIVIECLAEEHTVDFLVIFQELDIKTFSIKMIREP